MVEYIGQEGLQQIMVDAGMMQQEVAVHLESSRSLEWKEKTTRRYHKPLGEVNIAGLSYELVSSASGEADALLIKKVHGLATDIFKGNAANFLKDDQHRLWETIRRETRDFIRGYELGKGITFTE